MCGVFGVCEVWCPVAVVDGSFVLPSGCLTQSSGLCFVSRFTTVLVCDTALAGSSVSRFRGRQVRSVLGRLQAHGRSTTFPWVLPRSVLREYGLTLRGAVGECIRVEARSAMSPGLESRVVGLWGVTAFVSGFLRCGVLPAFWRWTQLRSDVFRSFPFRVCRRCGVSGRVGRRRRGVHQR